MTHSEPARGDRPHRGWRDGGNGNGVLAHRGSQHDGMARQRKRR